MMQRIAAFFAAAALVALAVPSFAQAPQAPSAASAPRLAGAPDRATARRAQRLRLLHVRRRVQARRRAAHHRLRHRQSDDAAAAREAVRARGRRSSDQDRRGARPDHAPAAERRHVRQCGAADHADQTGDRARAGDRRRADLRQGGRRRIHRNGAADDAAQRRRLHQHRREQLEPSSDQDGPHRRPAVPRQPAVRVGNEVLLPHDARVVEYGGSRRRRPGARAA